jgi:anti-sigma factor RsiW
MVCEEVIRQLSNYLEGELDPALRQALELHLEDCEDCSIVVNTARKTVELYCGNDPLPLPADLQGEIERALTARMRNKT